MEPELARRAHALLTEAMDLEGSERAAYVAAACDGRPDLLRRVQRLLSAVDQTGEFLETPALALAATPHEPEPEPPERVIGAYRTIRVLGAGGMATVYEAMQEQPRRRVALKVMRRALAGSSAVRRFEFETEVLAKLQHPGIAQIYEAGAADEEHGVSTPYFALEFVPDASTITDYAEARRLGLHERLAMFADVCDAVHHGHQHGVIHRDLKPGNILVGPDGRPKVIDFGVARSSDPARALITQQTSVGQLIGTLHYMSPEQCRPGADVDIRTDVYSLGVVLYQLVCGRLPHELATLPIPAALRVVIEDDPRRPSVWCPAAHGDVEAIVLKALEKSPERRYQSAAALGADLRRFLRHQTIEARPPTVLRQCRLFARRNRALVAAGVMAMLATTAAAIVSTVSAVHAQREAERRREAERLAVNERDKALWQMYIADIAAAVGALQTGETQLLKTHLAAAPPIHRGWEWRLLNGLADSSLRTLAAHDDMIFASAASPDGQLLATGSRDGSLRVWRIADGAAVFSSDGDESTAPHALAFMADPPGVVRGNFDGSLEIVDLSTGGRRELLAGGGARIERVACSRRGLIAAATDGGAGRLWSGATGELLRTFDDQPGGVHGVAFSPDGETLLTWGRRGTAWVRTGAGEPLGKEFAFDGSLSIAVFSADGFWIAAAGSEGRVEVWDVAGESPPHRIRTPWSVSTIISLAFSPTGRTVAVGQVDRTITLLSAQTGEQLARLRGHEEAVSGLWISGEGRRLLSASWDRTIREWDIAADAPPDFVTALEGHEGQVLDVAFSPDGELVASASSDGTVRLWDPELAEPLGVLGRHRGAVYAVRFSPDGSLIATGDGSGAVRLWSAATGATAGGHAAHPGSVWALVFSPDGRRLASAGEQGAIRVWEVRSETAPRSFEGHGARVNAIDFSPDGRLLASGSRDGTVALWDVGSGERPRELGPHRADTFAVLFSPDGRHLYTGSRDQTVAVWSVETGVRERELAGHGQFITGLALSPDERRLVASSWFGEIVLWDTGTLDMVASFKGHDNAVRAVAFGAGGRWLASASHDRTIRLWDASERQARSGLVERAHRDSASAAVLVERLLSELGEWAAVSEALGRSDTLGPGERTRAKLLVLERSLGGG